jgi:CBS-domain-containing membrane protein
MEILSALQGITVAAFAGQRPAPITLDPSVTVKDALKTFNTEKVLSCPISNSTRGADVWGFLDLFDLLSYLLDLLDENEHAEQNDITHLGEKFMSHTIRDLTDRSDNDVYAAVVAEERAHRLVRLFGLGVHRVAMLDMKGTLVNVISQSDVIRYLNANIGLLGDNAGKSIKELNMISKDEMVVADADQSALVAFKLLATNLVSAVPLVDKQGVLAGTLSVSDLRLLQDDLTPLQLSALQYKSIKEPLPHIVCTPSTTLGEVVATLSNSNVHRVWVVDDANKPVSVISITNICELLSTFIPDEEVEK